MIQIKKDGIIFATEFIENLDTSVNYFNFDTHYRCWNGGSSNVCSFSAKTGPTSFRVKGKATTNPSNSGYAYVYTYYDVPIGQKYEFSCTVKNSHASSTVIGLRLRDGINGASLSSTLTFMIFPDETREISVSATVPTAEINITPAFSVYSDSNGYIDMEVTNIKLNIIPDSYDKNSNFLETGEANFEGFNEIGITDNLIGYWPLTENTIDYSGYDRDGTLYGGAKFKDNAIYCDGINSTIRFGTGNTFFPLKEFTINLMFKSEGTTPTTGTAPGLYGYTYGIRSNINGAGNISCIVRAPDGTATAASSGYNYHDNKWHMLTHVLSNTKAELYIDGELVTSVNAPLNWEGVTNWPTNAWQLGRDNNNSNQHYKGYIKEHKLFNKALTAEEIKLEYNTFFNEEVQIHKSKILYTTEVTERHRKLIHWLDGSNPPVNNVWKDSIGNMDFTLSGATHNAEEGYYKFTASQYGLFDSASTIDFGDFFEIEIKAVRNGNNSTGIARDYIFDFGSVTAVPTPKHGFGVNIRVPRINGKINGNNSAGLNLEAQGIVTDIGETVNILVGVDKGNIEGTSNIFITYDDIKYNSATNFTTFRWNNFNNPFYLTRGITSGYEGQYSIYDIKIYKVEYLDNGTITTLNMQPLSLISGSMNGNYIGDSYTDE